MFIFPCFVNRPIGNISNGNIFKVLQAKWAWYVYIFSVASFTGMLCVQCCFTMFDVIWILLRNLKPKSNIFVCSIYVFISISMQWIIMIQVTYILFDDVSFFTKLFFVCRFVVTASALLLFIGLNFLFYTFHKRSAMDLKFKVYFYSPNVTCSRLERQNLRNPFLMSIGFLYSIRICKHLYCRRASAVHTYELIRFKFGFVCFYTLFIYLFFGG